MFAIRRVMVLLTLLSLCLGAFAGMAQDENVLVIGHVESTDSLDPARGYTQTTGIINKAVEDKHQHALLLRALNHGNECLGVKRV